MAILIITAQITTNYQIIFAISTIVITPCVLTVLEVENRVMYTEKVILFQKMCEGGG